MQRRRRTLALLAATFAVSHLDRQIMSISLDAIGKEFQLSDAQLGVLSGVVFAVVFAVFGLPIARFAAWRSRKTIIAASVFCWSTLTALTAGAQSFAHLAMARIGVGIAEAGGVAPAHSLISDLYPEHRRTSAMAAFVSGGNLGVLLAFLIGGIVGQLYGWRWAFIIAGLPGIVLAVLLWRYAEEPAPPKPDDANRQRRLFFETLGHFRRNQSLMHALIGLSIVGIVTFGALSWNAVFMIRALGLNVAQAGIVLALVVGIGGAIGTCLSGVLADRYGDHDPRWRMGIVIAAILIAKPFVLCFLLAPSPLVALLGFAVSGALATIFWAPTFAYMHGQLPRELRPMATAVTLFAFNIVGMGLGPTVVGILSDMLAQSYGPRSIGVALAIVQIGGIWACWHYWQVMRRMKLSPAWV